MPKATAARKIVRAGAVEKRSAILAGARELILSQGVNGASMDAISARAGVSKVTVYDYFGDKDRLFRAVLSDAADSLADDVRRTFDEYLTDDADIDSVEQLEVALTAVAIELGSTIHSANYAAVVALVAQQRLLGGTTEDELATSVAERALVERIVHFAGRGLLDVEDAGLAARHFGALTVLLAYNDDPDPARADPDRARRTMVDGAHAFVRAYGTR